MANALDLDALLDCDPAIHARATHRVEHAPDLLDRDDFAALYAIGGTAAVHRARAAQDAAREGTRETRRATTEHANSGVDPFPPSSPAPPASVPAVLQVPGPGETLEAWFARCPAAAVPVSFFAKLFRFVVQMNEKNTTRNLRIETLEFEVRALREELDALRQTAGR